MEKNNNIDKIKKITVLNTKTEEGKMIVKLFVSVIEDISANQEIIMENEIVDN